MQKRKITAAAAVLLTLTAFICCAVSVMYACLPGSISVADRDNSSHLPSGAIVESDSVTAGFLGIIPVKKVTVNHFGNIKLIPGGFPFGLRLHTEGVVVAGLRELVCSGKKVCPAHEAGLRSGDIILYINGSKAESVENVTDALSASLGKPVSLSCRRGTEAFDIYITPVVPDGENGYKAGMYIRDDTAGIGTVTFIDPDTGNFGGLGHGICDMDSGRLLTAADGSVCGVTISGVVRGQAGTPGELRGYFENSILGKLTGNSEVGVFGHFDTLPEAADNAALPVAMPDEVKEGKAYILTTVGDNVRERFEIEIEDIDRDESRLTKSFSVRVTDPGLLEISGGIVQGMSGSPIIQNGKLIGAVTHVLINDPTRGYGIFISNMLSGMSAGTSTAGEPLFSVAA